MFVKYFCDTAPTFEPEDAAMPSTHPHGPGNHPSPSVTPPPYMWIALVQPKAVSSAQFIPVVILISVILLTFVGTTKAPGVSAPCAVMGVAVSKPVIVASL